MRGVHFLVLAAVLLATPTAAQEIATARSGFQRNGIAHGVPAAPAMRVEGDTTVGQMLATGTFAAFLGVVGGAFVGARMATCEADGWGCGIAEGAIGALVGSTVMVPLGVHLVSRHSPFLAKFGTSVAVLGVFAAFAWATNPLVILVTPLAQIIATVGVEEIVARREGASWAQP